MQFLQQITKYAMWMIPLLHQSAMALCPDPFGIIGGTNGSPFAYLLQPDGKYSPQLLPAFSFGSVNSVTINGAGLSLMGGLSNGSGFTYYVYPDGTLSPPLPLPGVNTINSVDLNDSGMGLIGGVIGGNAGALLVLPNFSVTTLPLLSTGGSISAVAINSEGRGLLGGQDGTPDPLGYLVYPGGIVTQLLPPGGTATSVDINDSNLGIIGGIDGSANAFAYQVLASGTTSPQLLPPISGSVNSVAINAPGISLIGGDSGGTTPFAYFIYADGSTSNQILPTLLAGSVNSVAINDGQTGLIGGNNGLYPMLYLVEPNGTLSPQLLPEILGGTVNEVALNMFNAGLAVGNDGTHTFAYLLTPSGEITAIYPTLAGQLNTGTLIKALSQVPTKCLGGNNLKVANYINQYAPEAASYLLPSLVDGTLNKALASVAPTRNAANLFTASNNLFLLNQGLSRHLRNRHYVDLDKSFHSDAPSTANRGLPTNQLVASINPPVGISTISTPYTLWGEVIGAFASQKAEHQAPGFDPLTGGVILAFEAALNPHSQLGGGAAYTYTHIHQHRGAGYSHLNQEYLFAYALWSQRHYYVDGALWGGIFQIHQVRKIHLPGFEFTSTSTPFGSQLSPHLEVGGDFQLWHARITLEPFAMFDWANAWQGEYKEHGQGPFNMGQKSHYASFLRSEVGLRLYEILTGDSVRVTFQEKLSYVNKKPFCIGTVHAFLVGSPGAFTVETLSTPQNLGLAEFAMIFEPLDSLYPYGTIAYQGEFSVPYQSHQIALELCWSF